MLLSFMQFILNFYMRKSSCVTAEHTAKFLHRKFNIKFNINQSIANDE